jgi:hypothetical protein
VASAIVCRTWSDHEAQLVKSILEIHGIPVHLDSDLSHSLYPLTVDGLGEVRVLVPGEAGEEARDILAGYRARGSAPDA